MDPALEKIDHLRLNKETVTAWLSAKNHEYRGCGGYASVHGGVSGELVEV